MTTENFQPAQPTDSGPAVTPEVTPLYSSSDMESYSTVAGNSGASGDTNNDDPQGTLDNQLDATQTQNLFRTCFDGNCNGDGTAAIAPTDAAPATPNDAELASQEVQSELPRSLNRPPERSLARSAGGG